jgi:hypothetical protein
MCNNCINKGITITLPPSMAAENAELKLQVEALTQALETQKRENQPYLKALERQITEMGILLKRCLNGKLPESLHDDVSDYLSTINTAGGANPESK